MYDDVIDSELAEFDRFWDGEDVLTDWLDDGFDDEADDWIDDGFDDGFDDGVDDWIDESDDWVDGSAWIAEELSDMFPALTPAESVSLSNVFGQIGQGAVQAFNDPTVRQVAGVALPIAGGAIGTAVGGPVGMAAGTALGGAAGKALAPAPPISPAVPSTLPPTRPLAVSPTVPAAPIPPKPVLVNQGGLPATTTTPIPTTKPPVTPTTTAKPMATAPPVAAKPAIASGSAAATKALVCSQQPDVLKALLALALGERGATSVRGVPVGAIMNMLSTIFANAAADADELLAVSERPPAYLLAADGSWRVDPASPGARADALYASLVAEDPYAAAGWRA